MVTGFAKNASRTQSKRSFCKALNTEEGEEDVDIAGGDLEVKMENSREREGGGETERRGGVTHLEEGETRDLGEGTLRARNMMMHKI
jgi:hypothetical protein